MVSQNVFKILTTTAIFALTLVAALLPYKFRANNRFLSILNIMAGGVFLGAGLCHLLADSASQFNKYYESQYDYGTDNPSQLTHGHGDEPFPWAFCMAGIGFLITLIVEQIAHHLIHTKTPVTPNDPSENTIDSSKTSSDSSNSVADVELAAHHHNQDHSSDHHKVQLDSDQHENHHDSDQHNHRDSDQQDDDHDEHTHAPIHTEHQSIVVVVALWLALAFHSVCEGIAMGAANSEDSQSAIFIAILAHKGLESFSLGTSLIRSKASKLKYIIFCLLFACMTPIGVLIGHFVSKSADGIVAAYISGFAAGTFLYVATVGVIIPEIKKQQDTVYKCIAVAFGFAVMAVIAIWV